MKIKRALHSLFVLVGCCILSMTMGYVGVQLIADWRTPDVQKPDTTQLRATEKANAYAENMLLLMAAFDREKKNAVDSGDDALTTWVRRSFKPRINELRQQMNVEPSGTLTSELDEAIQSLVALVRSPEDTDLQKQARQAVLYASDAVRGQRAELERALGVNRDIHRVTP